jgi:hypothetical protein
VMRTQSIVREESSFIGIDYHKRHSVFYVLDAHRELMERGRTDHLSWIAEAPAYDDSCGRSGPGSPPGAATASLSR